MIPYLVLILLGLTGFFIASYINRKKEVQSKKMICPLRGECVRVINSAYGKLFGVNIEKFGMLYYGLVVLLYIFAFVLPIAPIVFAIFFYVSIGACIFSVYLICIQLFVIKDWCTWCLLSAMISFLILLVLILS